MGAAAPRHIIGALLIVSSAAAHRGRSIFGRNATFTLFLTPMAVQNPSADAGLLWAAMVDAAVGGQVARMVRKSNCAHAFENSGSCAHDRVAATIRGTQ